MSTHESAEDYLERILMLEEEGNDGIHAVDLASSLGYSKPSVSIALDKLINQNLVTIDECHHLHLTSEGRKIASMIYDRHKVLGAFFVQLGVPSEIAYNDACKIEHDLSNETFNALKKLYLANKDN
ncbi:MAG: metal-dependent transcriptional regulator [Bacilli bacterium]